MNKTTPALSALAVAMLLAATDARAENGRAGWYGGLDLGMAMPHEMDARARDSDVPTNCDQHLPRATVNIDGRNAILPFPLSDPGCARGQDHWENSFDLDNGPLLGLNVGYAWSGLRLEAEYFYRQHGGDVSGLEITSGDKNDEFFLLRSGIGDVNGHQFFGNVYHDFHDVSPTLIPYIGGGVGFMLAKMDYSATFHRNPDRAVIQDLGRHPDAAGTLTSEDEELSDTLWGYQLVAGVDYPLADGVFLGVKARYVGFWNDFKDGGPWNSLRSHASTIAPGGDQARYEIRTDDLGFWGVSLNLKYFF